MSQKAIQDHYPDALSHCYGCGRLNEHGLQLQSYWDGEETVAVFRPQPYHMAIPGYVSGGKGRRSTTRGRISPTMNIRITVLVENTVTGQGLLAEHGLACWIEYGSHRLLFDTGQGLILANNWRKTNS